jgi:hypothetical protein
MSNETERTAIEAVAHQLANRERTIASIRAFADWLEANQDVPAPQVRRLQYSIIRNTDEERVAEARRVAALLGVEVKFDDHGFTLECDTPAGIEYVASGFTDQGMADYDEEQAAARAVRKAREAVAAEPAWFDADAPRTWRWDPDAPTVEPEDVDRVKNAVGKEYAAGDDNLWRRVGAYSSPAYTWAELLRVTNELTEVVPPAQDGAR